MLSATAHPAVGSVDETVSTGAPADPIRILRKAIETAMGTRPPGCRTRRIAEVSHPLFGKCDFGARVLGSRAVPVLDLLEETSQEPKIL